ncbi:MAG TPA: hypothetical protein VG322_07980 [Candidatus Acidoferrales bacterium]|nr:hypothetical protein [Candidatus Acidoferrales bacterium]
MKDDMRPTAKGELREPTEAEGLLFKRFLDADFPGRNELAPLLQRVLVRTIDEDGGLELQSQVEGKAPVAKRVPVEAEANDEDGVVIHMLLHVVEGRPIELELFREDGARVRRVPPSSAFDLIVLPPAPETGWAHSRQS